MDDGVRNAGGWMLNAFEGLVFIAFWVAVVLLYGLKRSIGQAKQDPIRPSGPTEGPMRSP